ncbi:LysR substrate-binding domain-containing protein [Agrobacterium deltaense]|uniref:LysR substrate-binding domain-containing protein n=1 Tax=Agrobacterium deltaense TaxID=1183412 RepID=UPI003FD1013B
MTADHRLASRRVVTPNDLFDERVLVPGRNSPLRLALDRAFSIEDHQPISTMETSMLNCCHFASAGMGVGIVDHTSLRSAGAEVVAIPFEPKIEVSYDAHPPNDERRRKRYGSFLVITSLEPFAAIAISLFAGLWRQPHNDLGLGRRQFPFDGQSLR